MAGAVQKSDKPMVRRDGGVVGFVNRVLNHSDSRAWAWPWVHQSYVLGLVYPSALPLSPHPVHPDRTERGGGRSVQFSLLKSDESKSDDERSDDESTRGGPLVTNDTGGGCYGSLVKAAYYVWRFFPDMLSVCIGLLMAPFDATYAWQGWMVYVGMPALYMALIFVLMLQKGSAKFNLSRFVLETRPVTTMGYSSYALYLFQRIVFTFWMPLVYIGTWRGRYGMDIGDGEWVWVGVWVCGCVSVSVWVCECMCVNDN